MIHPKYQTYLYNCVFLEFVLSLSHRKILYIQKVHQILVLTGSHTKNQVVDLDREMQKVKKGCGWGIACHFL